MRTTRTTDPGFVELRRLVRAAAPSTLLHPP